VSGGDAHSASHVVHELDLELHVVPFQERPDEARVPPLNDQRPARLFTPFDQEPVGPRLEAIVVIHEQVAVFRVSVPEVNSPQRRASRQVEPRLDPGHHGQDLVLERVQNLLEPGWLHG
jgi:hypothetical protein